MGNDIFIEICKDKFSYLIEEFRFNNFTTKNSGTRFYVVYEKPNLKIKIVNHISQSPEQPIIIYIITEEKKLFNRFFKKVRIHELDDLLILRKCNTQVYEYLDYNNIDTFYKVISEEKMKCYRERYSTDEEIKIIVDKYSRLLRDFASDILGGNFDILPEVRKLREEYDKKYHCGAVPY